MDSNKYLMALIKLPILIKPDGNVEPLNQHIQLEIIPCEDVVIPPKNDDSVLDDYYKKQIAGAFTAHLPKTTQDICDTNNEEVDPIIQDIQNKLFVNVTEILKPRQPSMNITFKNKKMPRRFTAKSR